MTSAWGRPDPTKCRAGKHDWVYENISIERGPTRTKLACKACKRDRKAESDERRRSADPVANGTAPQKHWANRSELVAEYRHLSDCGVKKPDAATRLGVTLSTLNTAISREKKYPSTVCHACGHLKAPTRAPEREM